MSSPSKGIASRYLESLGEQNVEPLKPLQPSSRFNSPPRFKKTDNLDKLASELNANSPTTPNKTYLLRSKFDSTSATVSSFKSRFENDSNLLSPKSQSTLNFNHNNQKESPSPLKNLRNSTYNSNPTTPTRHSRGTSNADSISPVKRLVFQKEKEPQKDEEPIYTKRDFRNNLKSSVMGSSSSSTPAASPQQKKIVFSGKKGEGYEYLCRIAAAKQWIEECIGEQIPTPVELIEYIRNGIVLAKLTKVFKPQFVKSVCLSERLQYRHTENINYFFKLLDFVGMPDLFRFELTDLYDKKNIPKVWFCLHALSFILSSEKRAPKMKNLVGELEFSDSDINQSQRSLLGIGLPNFATIGGDDNSEEESEVSEPEPESESEVEPESEPEPEPESESEESLVEESEPEYEETQVYESEEEEEVQETELPPIEDLSIRDTRYDGLDPTRYLDSIIKIQALSRGSIFRYRMFIDRIMIRSFSDEVTSLTAAIRGKRARNSVHRIRLSLSLYEDAIINLQTLIRGSLERDDMKKSLSKAGNRERNIIDTQSAIRGYLVRNKIKNDNARFRLATSQIIELQSIIRMNPINKKVMTTVVNNNLSEPSIRKFQDVARGFIARTKLRASIRSLRDCGSEIMTLQNVIRGNRTRNHFQKTKLVVNRNVKKIKELQSIGRGAISRGKLFNNILITLYYQESQLNQFFANIRGILFRSKMHYLEQDVESEEKSVIKLQSLIRGILGRFKVDVKLDDLYDNITDIVEFQAIAKGKLLRNEQAAIWKHYDDNIDKVITIQGFIKTSGFKNAYKSLITMKNPPLSVIRRFANLLTQNELDYNEEIMLQKLKDSIIEKSKHNEDLEQQTESLDIKLGLLAKNKITIEEFVKHKNKYKSSKPATSSKSQDKLQTLNKPSRDRIELYQTLFYVLQTKPIYFIRLFNSIDKNDKLVKEIESIIMKLYRIDYPSLDKHSREEYFFVKLMINLMENDVKRCSTISDFTKQNKSFWIDSLLNFNNQSHQRQFLKSLLGKAVVNVVDNEELDFESDPSTIYSGCVERELRRTGELSRPDHAPPEIAIKDPETSQKFVHNLMGLREYASALLSSIEKNIQRFPLHIKVLCQRAYYLSSHNFPDKTEKHHLSVAGIIFIKYYISTILTSPENYGIITKDPFNASVSNKRSKENLLQLAKVLLQVFSMRPFSDTFLQPLNDYVTSSLDNVRQIIKQLISVADLEEEYKMSDYDDIVNHDRPTLTMRVSDMISIHKLIREEIDIVAPAHDDSLQICLGKLTKVSNSPPDLVKLSELGEIVLNLNPSTKEDSLSDSKIKSLFMQSKRSVLYIIRVQKGSDLLELLISKIKPEHEYIFKEIIMKERKELQNNTNSKRPYAESSLGDLSKSTYHDLKRMALEIILQLEKLGELTRKNSFQEILNQIAIDIRTNHDQRLSRKHQLDIAVTTNDKLLEKERFLTKQLNDYNKYIDTMLSELQSKPKDRKILNFIPVLTKQYFYHRELRKTGRLPKFGSYKYNVKKLMDQGILLDVKGVMAHRLATSSKLELMFNCNEAGKFSVEAASGSVNIAGAFNKISLDDLLNLQYENKSSFEMFDGMALFDTNNLIGLILKKFYDIKNT